MKRKEIFVTSNESFLKSLHTCRVFLWNSASHGHLESQRTSILVNSISFRSDGKICCSNLQLNFAKKDRVFCDLDRTRLLAL